MHGRLSTYTGAFGAQLPIRQKGVRAHLVALVIALIIPILLFATLLFTRYSQSERSRYETEALEVSRRLTAVLDRDLATVQSALQAFATSRLISSENLPDLYQQATELSRLVGAPIVVKDPSGQQIVNTQLPWGTSLPISLPEGDRKALESGQVYVSDLFRGAVTQPDIISVNVPVVRSGAVIALINAGIIPRRFADLLNAQNVSPEWTAAIVDRQGMIVARSRLHDRYVGTQATADLRERAVGEEGVWTGFTAEGTPVLAAYTRSRLSEWRVAVGIPSATVKEPFQRSLIWLAIAGSGALLTTGLIASYFGGRMARPMRELAESAAAIGQDGQFRPATSTVREITAISTALYHASKDLRRSADERDRAQRRAADNAARLERVLNTSPVGIVEFNDRGRIVYANTAAGNILAMSSLDLDGRQHDDITGFEVATSQGRPLDGRDMPAARVLRGETVSGVECAIKRKVDGQRIVISANGAPVCNADGAVVGALVAFVDISERHSAETALRRAQDELQTLNENLDTQVRERTAQLEQINERLIAQIAKRELVEAQLRQSQKMEAIGQLTGGIAHDFNNLLSIILGNLEMLRKRLEKGDVSAIPRYIAAAVDGANRAATLTKRLLAFSSQQPLEPRLVNPNALISGMADMIQRSLGERITVEAILATNIGSVHADPSQIENALLNLVVNAQDAMPEGGTLTIETSNVALDESYAAANHGVAKGEYVLIAVTDTGCGMPAEVVAKAFEPFFTTKAFGKSSGLGLSQVYGFVAQSAGHVKIDSQEGCGTAVKLYFPRFQAVTPVMPLDAENNDVAVASDLGTILVVEDEERVRKLSVEALLDHGFQVIEADNASSALREIEARNDISLLFTDVVMPDINGRKLADQALLRRPNLKVLFTTGYSQETAFQHGAFEPGMQLLPKPFTVEELTSKVRRILGSGRE